MNPYPLDLSSYQKRLGLGSAVFTRIDHEDAIVAIVYRLTTPKGEEFILKICERNKDYLREMYFLSLLANHLPVPKIIEALPPGEGTHGAILMEYLDGMLLKPHVMSETLAQELGRSLALTHQNRLSKYGDLITGDLYNHPSVYFSYKFEQGLDECRNHLPSNLVKACHEYHVSHLPLLSAVDGPCIVHRDFRPGNLIVQNGKLKGIIDWASARASFAEEDFGSLKHPDWWYPYEEHFLSGYAMIRPVPNYKPLIPLLRLNKAVATVGFTVKRGTWKTKDAVLYQSNLKFLENLLLT